MTRLKNSDAEVARAELKASRTRPDWRANPHFLPFHELSPDEFEIFCFLLLLKEHPGDRIYYYGKTSDQGRDILQHCAGKIRLIQCKRFNTGNVGVGEIREELAKLCVNTFSKKLPETADEVIFYIVPDVTNPAGDLIRQQVIWRKTAEKALEDFLKETPSKELLSFAHEWWPEPEYVTALSLTERARKFDDLIEEFFAVRKVIDGSIHDVQKVMREELRPVVEKIAQIQPLACEQISEPTEHEPEEIKYNDVVQAFRQVSHDLLSWPTTLESDTWLNRPELDNLASRLERETSSTTILVGSPGSGKSALLAKLGDRVDPEAVVLALKADLLAPSIDSLGSLSEQLHLPTMITDCVRIVASSGKVVVLIDQLDALADLLDLRAGRLNALLSLVKRLNGLANVHIVCSCRTFEFGHDTRLTSIDAEIIELTLPSWEDITAILQRTAIIPGNWPDECRTLLRTPQHLKVFFQRLKGRAEDQLFTTYQQLLDDLWKQRIRSQDQAQLLMDIADSMAKQETIWLPLIRFEEREHLVSMLEAEDILMRSENGLRIGFRHQTLFEHARARAFARGHGSLCTYVMERQNALFVRPVLWSSLHYLRGADPDAYQREMGSLWEKPVRKHVRHLLIEFLGQVSSPAPTQVEQMWLMEYLQKPEFRNPVLAAIRGNYVWFKILADTHFPAIMRADKEAWVMVDILGAAGKTNRTTCLRLVQQEWLPDSSKDHLTFRVLESLTDWDQEALGMAERVVGRSDISRLNVMGLASGIAETSPSSALKVVRVALDRELTKAEAEPAPTPPPLPPDATESDHTVQRLTFRVKERFRHLLEHCQEWHELPELAEASPVVFVSEIWPWLIRVIEHLLKSNQGQTNLYLKDESLATELPDTHEDWGRYVHTGAMDLAIREMARIDQVAFLAHFDREKDRNMLVVQRLLCRGLCELASSHSDTVIDFLTADPRRLMLGGSEDQHQDTISLINSVIPHSTESQIEKLEAAIAAWSYLPTYSDFPPDQRRQMLRYDRESRLRLFTAIAPERLSQSARTIVQKDVQTFPFFESRRTCSISGGVVRSPMSAEQMGRASNRDIVNLFVTLAQKREPFIFDHLRGGLHEAAFVFKEFAKTHPERAADIFSQLTPGKHDIPVGYGIEGISQSEFPCDSLFDSILLADKLGFGGEYFQVSTGRALEFRVEKNKGLPDTICIMLERWLTEWPTPSPVEESQDNVEESSANERPHSILWQTGGSVTIPFGPYHALRALTYGYLLREPASYGHWISVLEKQIERSDQVGMWQVFSHDLRYLSKCDHSRAERFVCQLFEKYPGVRDSVHGASLLTHAWRFLPSFTIFQILHDMRDGSWNCGPQVYGELLALFCMLFPDNLEANQELEKLLDQDVEQTETYSHIRTGLAFAAANRRSTPTHHGKANDILLHLIPHADTRTSHAIMHSFVKMDVLSAGRETESLLRALHAHPTVLQGTMGSFFEERLEDILSTYPELVLSLCEDLVDLRQQMLSESQNGFIEATAQLTNMALTFQRLDGNYRGRGLDLFERLIDIGVHDAFVTLNELDKRIPNLAMSRVIPVRSRRARRRKRKSESGQSNS